MEVKFYDTMEEMYADDERNRIAADARVTLPQASMVI